MKNNREAKRYNKKLILGIIITTLVLVLGTSYAFFTLTLKAEKELSVTTGVLQIDYKDKNTISLENAYPMSDQKGMMLSPYEFSVENTGDLKVLYDISLEEKENSNLEYQWLKYAIKKNEEEWSSPKRLSSLKLEEGLELDPTGKDTYQLRLWIDENIGNEAQGKVFLAKVIVNSVQSNAKTEDVVPPVITLNGSLSESVEQGAEYTDPGVASVSDDRDTLDKDNVALSYQYFDGETTKEVESVDTGRVGVYYIYYKLKDTSGNEGRVIRCVNVYKKDTTPPVIRLNGKERVAIEKDSHYEELGATASKNEEDLTNRIVTVGTVNTKRLGTYEIKYLITDQAGNCASIVRVVNVVYISNEVADEITIDLSENPRDKVNLEGENLGEITYTSSDDSIASVDRNGNVEGHQPGEVTITITTSTGVKKEVFVKVVKTVRVTYTKQGSGVTSIGKTSDSCKITGEGGSCEVVAPEITVSSGYTAVGWNIDRNATTGTSVGSKIALTGDTTYYSISYQNGATYTVNFNANGNTIAETSKSCTIDKNYNGEAREMSCRITTPVITAPSETPTVIGYNEDKTAKTSQIGSGETLVLTANNNGKTYYAITKKAGASYTVNFNANGNTIAATSKSCSIAETYNGVAQASGCSITTPVITAPSNTPTVVGYNQDKSAKTSQVGSNASLTVTSSVNGKTYYAITKKAAVSYSVNFNANGNTIAATSKSCSIAETYNGTAQGTSCNITTPVITAPTNTPTVVGYNQDKTAKTSQVGSNTSLSVTSSNNGKTYYAITKKAAITRSVTYTKGAGVSSIGKTSDSCSIGETYNNTAQATSCSVSLPSITSSTGYNTGFWSTSNTATSGTSAGTSISLSSNATYYARALDTTKPVWSLVSTSPTSGTITSSDTLTITFKGTDTSGSVTSTLAAGNITVKAGSTTVSPSTKTLSAASNVTNGKQYTLTLSGINTDGVISITIAASTLKDGSNNANVAATFTTSVTIKNPATSTLLNKVNPTTLTYANATDAQKKEMFTFTHTAGEQQSGWSAEELTDYRYIGTSVNNYVTFNNETWRIIGVFTVEDENGKKEKRMKIIRNELIGTYSWDNKGDDGENDWSNGALQKVLNSGAYYNRTSGRCPYGPNGFTTTCDFSSKGLTTEAKSMIGKTKWYLGRSRTSILTASQFYGYERGIEGYGVKPTSWVGEVGLMYPSDFGYAASGSSCLSTDLFNYYLSCMNTDWLHNSSYSQWTINSISGGFHYGLYVHSLGRIADTDVVTSLVIRPSLYLKSNVSITSGDGSSGNPYKLTI